MELVINEWFPEYFKPNATVDEKKKLMTFFEKLIKLKDVKIVVRRPSPFLEKLLKFEKFYANDVKAVGAVKLFIRLILRDSDRCRFIDDGDTVALPGPLVDSLSVGNYNSDTYLFEAAYCIGDNPIIVTTDGKLQEQVQPHTTCQVILLDDFLKTFGN